MTFEEFQNKLAIHFHDQTLLKQAFIHRSYLNEDKKTHISNERLEFLGDAILSFLTSQFLYSTYPEYPEGVLTNIRSGLVKTKTLAEIAKTLGLGELLFLSHGEEESGGRSNQSLLADSFEAFLGAMYLDQGLEVCKSYLEKYLFIYTQPLIENKAYIDFKSHLQEVIQETTKISPIYKVVKTEGPDHNKTFWVDVYSNNLVLGTGMGKSKQEAEQKAAANALEKMNKT